MKYEMTAHEWDIIKMWALDGAAEQFDGPKAENLFNKIDARLKEERKLQRQRKAGKR